MTERDKADRIMDQSDAMSGNWSLYPSCRTMRDAIEAAITSAREVGRREGLDEAAKKAECCAVWGQNWRRDIAAAIRALSEGPRP